MTKTATKLPAREPRPFLFLPPARLPLRAAVVDPQGLACLQAATDGELPALVRQVVDFTIARQHAAARPVGRARPLPIAVLNRRRRAARCWLLAVLAGQQDAGTQHAVQSQWLPLLCGSEPEPRRLAREGRALVEFVRGAVTALVFAAPRENLLPEARALYVLESTLAVHLAALLQAARAAVQV